MKIRKTTNGNVGPKKKRTKKYLAPKFSPPAKPNFNLLSHSVWRAVETSYGKIKYFLTFDTVRRRNGF